VDQGEQFELALEPDHCLDNALRLPTAQAFAHTLTAPLLMVQHEFPPEETYKGREAAETVRGPCGGVRGYGVVPRGLESRLLVMSGSHCVPSTRRADKQRSMRELLQWCKCAHKRVTDAGQAPCRAGPSRGTGTVGVRNR